ncbi:T9SS type B sorting domain-containing protein [Tamlana sp. I1]|uniref:T9SS type B sorting domain-containing protein n=1 Tax=Tamlana sp. I1 TaxID=2762061 RepID=UPI00188F5A88|nr:T9SS type B sorting domain-containing protein [Tamlana sp. I1]
MKNNLLLLLYIVSFTAFAQNEAANWYFGHNSGIHFDSATNTVTALQDGKLNTIEGCTSISDESGNLLFYTNGISVWNKNHDVMPNGYGLYGDPSSTQSAIIIPKPNDQNIYYVFTVDDSRNNSGVKFGFNYSIVDLTLEGGLGDITTKNINLLQDSSEKLTAVLKDCSTKSIWVLTFASYTGHAETFDTFHAFEVSNSGVNSTSVKSTFPKQVIDPRGYLKLSPDGLKLACANSYDGLDLYNFDVATGKVSNPISLIPINASVPYGLEFSPDSQLLYAQTSNVLYEHDNPDLPETHRSKLIQYNLASPNIPNSAVTIDDRQLYRGALQLGPNGKIYRALSATYNQGLPYLAAINDPNQIGLACDYTHQAINLAPGNSSQGLPPFIASFFNKQIDIINNGKNSANLDLCEGGSYTLKTDPIPGATFTWSKNGSVLPETGTSLYVSDSGHYELHINPNNGDCEIEGEAYVSFNKNPDAFNYSLIQCEEDAVIDGITTFNLNEATEGLTGNEADRIVKFYTDSARTQEANADAFQNTSNPQTLYVTVINENTTCFSFAELTLEISNTDANDVALYACDDDGLEDGLYNFNLKDVNSNITTLPLDIVYYETYDDALLEQNPLGENYTNTTPYSQTIFARIENANSCYGISNVLLTVNRLPEIHETDLSYYCLNTYPSTITINAAVLSGSPTDYTYNWSTGETTYEIQINEAGIYTVDIMNSNGCSKTRTVTVEASNIATISNIEVVDVTQNNTITVLVSGEGAYQYQLSNSNNGMLFPYQDSNLFENVYPGHYTVSVRDIKNNCGVVRSAVSVIGFPKFFTPNNDGINDTWQVYGLSEIFQPQTKILIFDRLGKLLKELNPLGEGWNGQFNGQNMPTGDYWFSVQLQDGRVYKNHFTLKN